MTNDPTPAHGPRPTVYGPRPTAPIWVSYGYGLLVAAGLAHFLLGIPVQVSDSFGNMLKLDRSWSTLLVDEFTQPAYLRPFLFAELKVVYDLSGGNYSAWFRAVHVVQIVALVLLYLTLVRPRTWRDAALVPLGLAVLVGLHTFKGTVAEAFPINAYLTIVLCCVAAASLAFIVHRWWVDVAAAVLLIVAALTVESGLLVGVVVIAAWLLGARGVSKAGAISVGALMAGYFVLRFALLDVGAPSLMERASGYGFGILEPPELVERFGQSPGFFYAYNVITSAASVLLSEPRAGVFRLTYGLTLRDPEPSAILNVVASVCATLVLASFAWRRRRSWLAWQLDRNDQLVLLFVAVLGANAAISYPYTKDVIMSPAGAFFAVAVFAAARTTLPDMTAPRAASLRVLSTVVCLALGATWALRSVSLHLHLRDASHTVRTQWAYVDQWLELQRMSVTDEGERALLGQLQADAVYRAPALPRFPLAGYRIFID